MVVFQHKEPESFIPRPVRVEAFDADRLLIIGGIEAGERIVIRNAPIVNQRQAQTTVSVRDGEAIILGGIIRKTVTSSVKKVPLLGDLPLLGNLFKSTNRADSKTELMVFLRPRIVRNAVDARKLTESTGAVPPP